MVKDDWPPPPRLHRISPEILQFRYSLHMVKDDWHPSSRILPEILKFRFSLHMVKDDWPSKTGFYQKFYSLDLVCTWSKMIDTPQAEFYLKF